MDAGGLSQRPGIAPAMIGTGLIVIAFLIGLRLSLKLLRFRGVLIFILLVGAVAIASIGGP